MKRNIDGSSAGDERPAEEVDEAELALQVSWGGAKYPVEIPSTSTVSDLKAVLFDLTEVLPMRQKVLGIPRIPGGPPVLEETVLSTIPFKVDQKLMLVGSREVDISLIQAHEASASSAAASEVVNDLDLDYSVGGGEDAVIRYQESNRRKLRRRLETTEIRLINEPRPGKKLLVLDLDYTLMDTKGMQTQSLSDLARPGLHRFLACCYRSYDIVVWSQTSWRWLEAKLTELSMLTNENYKITFVLDRTSMFSITSRRGREERRHEVKALEIVWQKFPGTWDATNTIHIDDLSRNFALNPQSGLKIVPYKNSRQTHSSDRELFYLMRYLSLIAREGIDFSGLNHKNWKSYCSARATMVLGDESDTALSELGGPSPAPSDQPGPGDPENPQR